LQGRIGGAQRLFNPDLMTVVPKMSMILEIFQLFSIVLDLKKAALNGLKPPFCLLDPLVAKKFIECPCMILLKS
jgi:hypothetical protein